MPLIGTFALTVHELPYGTDIVVPPATVEPEAVLLAPPGT